jgi:hypothetical protein
MQTQVIPVKLPNEEIIRVQATVIPSKQDTASLPALPFQEMLGSIEGIAQAVAATLKKVMPRKATVELGLEVAIESGKLIALLVKGTGTANLKITLEWESHQLPQT